MKQYRYRDYNHYKKAQIEANKRKLKNVFAHKSTMEYISSKVENVENILCHGSRNGRELKWFREFYPNAKIIIGTDISPTAKLFEDTVEWDFHNVNDEWTGKFDLVYTNAFDHSFDPIKALKTWIGQLKPNGILCVEMMTGGHNVSKESDPLELELEEYEQMLTNLGFDIFDIKDVKDMDLESRETVARLTMSRRI